MSIRGLCNLVGMRAATAGRRRYHAVAQERPLPLRFRVVFYVVHVADGIGVGIGDEAKPVVAMP